MPPYVKTSTVKKSALTTCPYRKSKTADVILRIG
jgi:hypothetical protein